MEDFSEINLDEMSQAEPKVLSKRVGQAIASFEARRLSDARDAVEALAKELGYSLSALVEVETEAKRRPAAAKYLHPENPQVTWLGRRRQSRWVAEVLAGGGSIEALAVAGWGGKRPFTHAKGSFEIYRKPTLSRAANCSGPTSECHGRALTALS